MNIQSSYRSSFVISIIVHGLFILGLLMWRLPLEQAAIVPDPPIVHVRLMPKPKPAPVIDHKVIAIPPAPKPVALPKPKPPKPAPPKPRRRR